MTFSYQVTFAVGGLTGNIVSSVTSAVKNIEVVCGTTPLITEPSDKSSYTQYSTTGANSFIVPGFDGGLSPGTKAYTLSGADEYLLEIENTGVNWVVKPLNTGNDDITYTFKVIATDGCSSSLMMTDSFYLHVGCPAAASSETFALINNAPSTRTLTLDESTTAIATLRYVSFPQ